MMPEVINAQFKRLFEMASTPEAIKRVEENEKRASEAVRDARRDLFFNCGIDVRFRGATLDSDMGLPQLRKLRDAVGKYIQGLAQGERNNCFIQGGVGTGKTWTACGALRKLFSLADHSQKAMSIYKQYGVKSYMSGRYILASDVVKAFCSKRWLEFQEINAQTPLFCIDEVGRDNRRSWSSERSRVEQNALFAMFDARYRKMLPTMILSNYTSSDLAEYTGEAFMSRLLENTLLLDTSGIPDLRLRG